MMIESKISGNMFFGVACRVPTLDKSAAMSRTICFRQKDRLVKVKSIDLSKSLYVTLGAAAQMTRLYFAGAQVTSPALSTLTTGDRICTRAFFSLIGRGCPKLL